MWAAHNKQINQYYSNVQFSLLLCFSFHFSGTEPRGSALVNKDKQTFNYLLPTKGCKSSVNVPLGIQLFRSIQHSNKLPQT